MVDVNFFGGRLSEPNDFVYHTVTNTQYETCEISYNGFKFDVEPVEFFRLYDMCVAEYEKEKLSKLDQFLENNK